MVLECLNLVGDRGGDLMKDYMELDVELKHRYILQYTEDCDGAPVLQGVVRPYHTQNQVPGMSLEEVIEARDALHLAHVDKLIKDIEDARDRVRGPMLGQHRSPRTGT